MNQHLQTILTLIQQSQHLSDEEKTALSKAAKDAAKELDITTFKLDRTEKVKRTTVILLEETIEELEQKRKTVEEKNRELEIENSLEKVRAIALSMKEPADMPEVCKVIAIELEKLGVKEIRNVQTAIFYDDKGTYMNYEYYARHNKSVITETSYTNHKIHQAFADQMLKGKGEFFSTHINEAELPGWVAYQKTTNVFIDTYLEHASSLNYYWYSLGPVALGVSTYVALSEEETNLFKRFRNVFELAYRRFLDIELAIGQAREARIETALERVRAVAMAMKKSEELLTVCEVMYKELLALGFTNTRNAQIAINEGGYKSWLVFEYSDYSVINMKKADSNVSPLLEEIAAEMSKSKDALFQKQITGKEFEEWRNWRMKADRLNDPRVTDSSSMCFYLYGVESGILGISTFDKISNEQIQTLKRFKNVFELSYRRYTDVAKAEAQAREAQIEAALEKVRSRSLAMHKSDEMNLVMEELLQRLKELKIDFDAAVIIEFRSNSFDVWSGYEAGTVSLTTFSSFDINIAYFKDIFEAKDNGQELFTHQYSLEEKNNFLNYLFQNTNFNEIGEERKEYLLQTKCYTVSIGFAKHTAIQLHSYSRVMFSKNDNEILKRFVRVFEQAYTRFNDLQIAEAHALQAQQDLIEIKSARQKAEETLAELQSTQKQLIQSEKMASLGELTAGIAHEIQNPLNFVNNFSEVSKELLDEMKAALENGNKDEAEEIANDIIQNLEKINHHGKRADAIVKGMLQHSRQTNGMKESTDINALCDEYLRLSYHGLRAKDKNFNADFKTDFDESISKINIVPQDIGRVLLNLVNNAFYATNTKQKTADENYKPLVSIQTKKLNDKIEISVKDNGNGIPQNIIDKIFQPFFTTKPTGEGTGLGLSLAYDIITKEHNGTIKVESKEGDGSKFIIQLSAY